MIKISQAAAQEIARMQQTRNQPNSQLRLKVEQGGCSGLFYSLDLENPEQQKSTEDQYFESHGISIIVDSQSYHYLDGLKLDYAEDLMGGGFRFQNPNATNNCGCGISFTEKKQNQH